MKRNIYGKPGDLSRPSCTAAPLDDRRYNVRLEFARDTELSMNAKAAELGVRGPKGLIVYALMQIGVSVDLSDRKTLRRMKQPDPEPGGSVPPPRAR
jgi:hypothetical protein